MNTKKIAGISALSALSLILAMVINIRPFPVASFLVYEPADVPIMLGAYIFGIPAGLIMTIVVSVIQGVTINADGGIIGIIMHLIATGTFVIVSGLIYKKWHSNKGLILSASIGFVVWVGIMICCNMLMMPLFTGAPLKAVLALMLPAILPFNLLKAGLNAISAVILMQILKKPINKFFGNRFNKYDE